MILDRSANLLNSHFRERGGDVEGGVNVILEVTEGTGPCKTSGAAIEGLLLYLQQLMQLSHAHRKAITGLLVGAEVLDFTS